MRHLFVPTVLIAVTLLSAVLGLALADDPSVPAGNLTPTVFYFHGERRCTTCRSIERTAESVLHASFAEQLKAGDLVFKVINFDKEANRHFIKELSLAGSGVVIGRVSPSGEIHDPKILQEVWPLAHDEIRMRKYLVTEITSYLDAR